MIATLFLMYVVFGVGLVAILSFLIGRLIEPFITTALLWPIVLYLTLMDN